MKTIHSILFVLLALGFSESFSQNKSKPLTAVMGIDSKGLSQDKDAVSYMVALEIEKTGLLSVMDKYDLADILKKNNIDPATCMGKTCLNESGKLLNVQKVISGSAERFGEKIVITLRMLDVATGDIEKSEATEFLNVQEELQNMIEISVYKLLGLTPDPKIVSMLIDFDQPINSPKTTLKLNGPRMGASMTFGDNGKRLQESTKTGGFDMFPVASQFGWQFEHQYMSAGEFQGLIESIFMISGLENGKFIPSFTFLNGFRFSKSGWEIGFGPSFRVIKKANGFYDTEGYLGPEGQWHLESEYGLQQWQDSTMPMANPYDIISRLDSRGSSKLSTGLVIAVGKTFKSGYLNIPVNAYVSPRKEGTFVGLTMGFNIARKASIQK